MLEDNLSIHIVKEDGNFLRESGTYLNLKTNPFEVGDFIRISNTKFIDDTNEKFLVKVLKIKKYIDFDNVMGIEHKKVTIEIVVEEIKI